MKTSQIRETLKLNGIKRTDVNATTSKGSSNGMVILTIRKKGFYDHVEALFGKDDLVYISCSNSLRD